MPLTPSSDSPTWEAVQGAAAFVKRYASTDVQQRDSALEWMEANVDLSIRAAIHVAGWIEDVAVVQHNRVLDWLREHLDSAAPLLLEYALRPSLPPSDPAYLGSPKRTLGFLATSLVGHEALNSLSEADRESVRTLALAELISFTHPPQKTPKWWPVELRGADQATLEKALLPLHDEMVALRASLPLEDRLAAAHAIVDGFIADKAKPENRWALLAALGLAPDPMARRLSRHAWTWSRSKNRNHRTLVGYVITYLRELATPEALARLALFAEGLPKDTQRETANVALRWIAFGRGETVDGLLAEAKADLGLADNGSLRLDFGPRQFTARFASDGSATITDGAGKRRASLPKPGKSDDAELAEAAKVRFAETRDDFRHLLRAHSRRLENALREQRRWTRAELDQMAADPVQRVILNTLVFRHAGGTFRLDEAGQLVDQSEEPAQVDEPVWLAHPSELSHGERDAWSRVLVDYELVSPWPQLRRSTFEGTLENGRVGTCEGWSLHPGSLMGLLQRGWQGDWRSGSTLVGLQRPVPGGTARVEFERFDTHEVASVGPIEIGALLVDVEKLDRIILSEILRDLDLVRASAK